MLKCDCENGIFETLDIDTGYNADFICPCCDSDGLLGQPDWETINDWILYDLDTIIG